MSFERGLSPRWHAEVPGARWLRADLHVHTIDDQPGGARMPAGVQGDPSDPMVLREYAQVFLHGVVRAGVQVLGLTPHATKIGSGPETSAVWQIIDAWNQENDEDGKPFRNKIYAVFPGFEPNVKDGGSGVHLLFLFDPEIGRDRFLALFDAVMDGRAPWDGKNLKLTSRAAKDVFKTIDERREEARSTDEPWDYLVLAPHFQNHHGLLWEVKRQVLESFPCHRLAGYELGDDKLPEDFDESNKPGLFLLPFMREHRQAFFHASDAYGVAAEGDPSAREVGSRTTWVKLASPRIEALRQAFLASESRLRIAYARKEDGSLHPLPEPPDPLSGSRPWLRQVIVRGEAAFFGGQHAGKLREVRVNLSPDLTCLIGGSMTGKSTLLDGLRVHTAAELPSDERLRRDVEARGRRRFLAGQPEVELDTPGRVLGEPGERWPAVFFTQTELQRLALDPGAVEEILTRLVPEVREAIVDRKARLFELDRRLAARARAIAKLLDERAEADQRLTAAENAQEALQAFEKAGLRTMQATEKLYGNVKMVAERSSEVHGQVVDVQRKLDDSSLERETVDEIAACLERLGEKAPAESLAVLHTRTAEAVRHGLESAKVWADEANRILSVVGRSVEVERRNVEKKLAELGHGAERLAEFQTLSRRAALVASYRAAREDVTSRLKSEQGAFGQDHEERKRMVEAQRQAFDAIKQQMESRFDRRIRVRRIEYGTSDALEQFLVNLKRRGITRWWNGLDLHRRPSPEKLFEKIQQSRLFDLGISTAVAERFGEVLTEDKGYVLRALRSHDRYSLELRLGNKYRDIGRLSGGRRVSLLLSLLLEAHDERPLVIDQPEDELDNRFLWETVLPALRRLKGRRQVVVATHNANIVVNGDADLVVQLEADAEHGRIAVSGAIEDPKVRRAIVETVDGGERAFELRKAKYGF